MKKLRNIWIILLAAGCREQYDSPVQSPVTGYLVVEGVVNSRGATSISLSRTTKFDNKSIFHEGGASVKMQGEDSSIYVFKETGAGQYGSDTLSLNTNIRYRLQITTRNNRQYVSDFVAVNNNPPIDGIDWKVENKGVQLYINTHDPLNNTRYYQWAYDEVWEYHSPYLSYLKYYLTRDPRKGNQYHVGFTDSATFTYNHDIVTCWQSYAPSSLFLSSTAKLSKDTVYLPLTYIPHGSVRLAILYSIRVKQYSWSKDGYAFLEKIKSNTEATGTIFDPQPSELIGNIHCVTDKDEPIIGFFNICPVREKRIFIKNSEVPYWDYTSNCNEFKLKNISDTIENHVFDLIPTVVESTDGLGNIDVFRAADLHCVDCTLTGTNKKPAFWP